MNDKQREKIRAAFEQGKTDAAAGVDRPPADMRDMLQRQAWRQGANQVKVAMAAAAEKEAAGEE